MFTGGYMISVDNDNNLQIRGSRKYFKDVTIGTLKALEEGEIEPDLIPSLFDIKHFTKFNDYYILTPMAGGDISLGFGVKEDNYITSATLRIRQGKNQVKLPIIVIPLIYAKVKEYEYQAYGGNTEALMFEYGEDATTITYTTSATAITFMLSNETLVNDTAPMFYITVQPWENIAPVFKNVE